MIAALPLSEYVRRVYPAGWTIVERWGDGYRLQERSGLRVIVSTAEYEGCDWMHVSLSRKDRLPSYDDMKYVKEVIIGNDRCAVEFYPPAARHVNIHQFCRHLWCPLTGGEPWPLFGEEGTI
jgi:hypothetical protein